LASRDRRRQPAGRRRDQNMKTPPGIGRRFEEKCRGRWMQYYTETFRFSILVVRVEPVDLAQQRRPYQRG
jgi:hypothetical protein